MEQNQSKKSYIQRSLSQQSVKSFEDFIEFKITEKETSDAQKSVTALKAISSLLAELSVRKVMTFEECFQFYSSHIKDITVLSKSKLHNAKTAFKDKLLGHAGLPVLLLTMGSVTFVLLIEDGVTDEICNSFQEMMESMMEQASPLILNEKLRLLAPTFHSLLSLSSTNKDRYLIVYILGLIFSRTGLKTYLDLNSGFVERTIEQVTELLWSVPKKMAEFEAESSRHVKETLSTLSKVIQGKTEFLSRKRKRLSDNMIDDYENEISNKKQKLNELQNDSSSFRKQYLYRRFRSWKENLLSQKGRKTGSYLIDREAETAIFNVLAENSKAHRRRHGEEGTVYLDEPSQRIQSREMLRIANDHLRENNKRLIKSKETVRSFGKPRNKRSVQAKHHRGRSLWSFTRSQKEECNRHINVHYNRAFVKNYTRLAFASKSKCRGRVLRLAMDDKCYLRCGTAEGFSRPLHKPLQLTQQDLKNELPSSDYPTKTGYVAPGVILMVNEQIEVEHNGRDKYTPEDVTVSVTCKPKEFYPSHATNWANDLYTARLQFRDEHELPSTFNEEHGNDFIDPSHAASYLIFMRDSLLQFELMTIEEDYLRVTEGNDHKAREKLRLSVLKSRIDSVTDVLSSLDTKEDGSVCSTILGQLKVLYCQIEELEESFQIYHSVDELREKVISQYSSLKAEARKAKLHLESLNRPTHRAVEIQTSDAGAGVGSKEKLTRIRLAEAFQIHSLDLQARLHYGPGDSRVHIAEKVMRSLNEHAGGGSTIPVPSVPITTLASPGEILAMTPSEFKELVIKTEQQEAYQCAESVASLYQGKPCMQTSICARVPNSCSWDGFFFDHEYMAKCHAAKSSKAHDACAGSAYFKYQEHFFSEHYRVYDGGVEGIRDGCRISGEKCDFHDAVESPRQLSADGWSDLPIERVNPPVPDYEDETTSHYCTQDKLESGTFKEKLSLKKAKVMSNEREIDDYCPRIQLHKLLKSCGKPNLAFEDTVDDDSNVTATPVDSNETMKKVLGKIDNFVEEYVGNDLKEEVVREARKQVENEIKSQMRKRQKQCAKEGVDGARNIKAQLKVTSVPVPSVPSTSGNTGSVPSVPSTSGNTGSVPSVPSTSGNTGSVPSVPSTSANTGSVPSVPSTSGNKGSVPSVPSTSGNTGSVPPVPPWGGCTIYDGKVVTLKNTCPIDNFLTMFHFICSAYPEQIENTQGGIYEQMVEVHEYFKASEYALGKLHWLEPLPHKVNLKCSVVNIFGNEFDFVISALPSVLETASSSVCSDINCPKRVIILKSYEVILPSDVPTNSPANTFNLSVSTWLHDKTHSRCLRKTRGTLCQGMRVHSYRVFVKGMPLIVPFNVSMLVRNGQLSEANQLPDDIQIKDVTVVTSYKLFGVNYGNGSHFKSAMCLPRSVTSKPGWYEYDGLWEYHQRGSGLRYTNSKPATPCGYSMSYALYVRQ